MTSDLDPQKLNVLQNIAEKFTIKINLEGSKLSN